MAIDNKTHWTSVDLSDSVQTKSFLLRKEKKEEEKVRGKKLTFLLLRAVRIKI